jgi:hypothetical protein
MLADAQDQPLKQFCGVPEMRSVKERQIFKKNCPENNIFNCSV